MPANSLPIDHKGAFYIDEIGLKALVESAKKFTGSDYNIQVTFNDLFSHDTQDIEKLSAHPHFRVNKAKSIIIRSSSQYSVENRSEIRIVCSNYISQGRFQADVASDTDDIHIIRAELEREIKSFRTKYDYLYRINGIIWLAAFIIAGFAFGSTLINGWLMVNVKDQSKEMLANVLQFSVVTGMIISVLALYTSNRLKMLIFPKFTLAIGKAKDEFATKADTRKWAYRAIVIAILGYIANRYFFAA